MIMDGCKNITTILNPSRVDSKDIGKNFTAQYRKKNNGFHAIYLRDERKYMNLLVPIFFSTLLNINY